ncbi:hypothetical protein [Isoptericola sp. NPDC056605]|uniref:hypothetical protein n=1 Tax=Isoptericola sp. NPDC056605 TaxID=3345876 RepID=UPI00369C0B33
MTDPLIVLALAAADRLFRDATGRLPERPGRDPELAATVQRQLDTEDGLRSDT